MSDAWGRRMRVDWSQQSKWYPPSRWVFMPIYRWLRKKTGDKRTAFTMLMVISGALHVPFFALVAYLIGGSAVKSTVFVLVVFAVLTVVAWTSRPNGRLLREAETR